MAAPGDVGTFHAWDYVVIATVLIISSCIGLFYAFVGGKQRTSKEFLLADRNMNPVPVSISLVASFISAVTVLGTPAEIYRNGTMYWLICIAVILTGIITSRTFLPIFYEYEISSTNEVKRVTEASFQINLQILLQSLKKLSIVNRPKI